MKILLVVLAVFFCSSGLSYAQTGTLSPSISLSVPTAAKIQVKNIEIYPVTKTMQVTYRWLTSDDKPIYKIDSRYYDQVWSCSDVPAQNPADCVRAGFPYLCCTGAGTGTGCNDAVTDFTDIFGFTIRSQDVGTKLGIGLRNLIIIKMKASIPALSGITITFAD